MSHRRSNKSAKVPNVKLRPVQPAERSSKSESRRGNDLESMWSHESGVDSEPDASFVDLCPRPFKGVVICATGVSDKMALFKQAMELGAMSHPDLTDRITHLIALEPGSAKYRCALENKIPIMHPSWITESHETWLRGDDVDLQQSIETHRLPIFTGVILTLSGMDDITRRTEVNRLLTQNGGTYVKTLERPVKVTHLLCASQSEVITEKMQYAQKFNQRGEADIKIVWEEWFWDSLDFGGRFDEEGYKVSNPPPQRRSLLETASSPPRSSSPPDDLASHSSHDRPRQTDLLTAAVHDEEEIASARRVPAEMLQIWSSLLKPRGFEVMNGRLVRSPSKSQTANESKDEQQKNVQREPSPSRSKTARMVESKLDGARKHTNVPTSALSTFRRTNSFAPVGQEAGPSRQPFRRVPTAGPSSSFLAHPFAGNRTVKRNVAGNSAALSSSSLGKETASEMEVSSKLSTLFVNMKFRALGEARGPNVKAALEECGGRLVSDEADDEVDFIIVRLVSGSSFYQEEVEEEERAKYRTECWLERCIFEERICAPDEHIAFRPLSIAIPVPGAEFVNLSHSGLDQSEACWVRRLARAIGANIAPNFSRRSTHLLCPSGIGPKAEKAREWGVPVVGMTWLADIAKRGAISPIATDGSAGDLPADLAPMEVETESAVEVNLPKFDRKGKGKEMASESTMADITNGMAVGSQSVPPQRGKDVGRCPQTQDGGAFGQPNQLLGGLSDGQSSPATPPPLSRSTSLGQSSGSDSMPPFGRVLVEDSRAPSLAAIERNAVEDRVPSSESPSPMKLLEKTSVSSAPPSPAKIPKEATKVLQESITSLLGKRPSTEDESTCKGQSSRLGKRARPPSRTKSLQEIRTPADPEMQPVPAPPDGFDPNLLGGDELDLLSNDNIGNESVRVIYEDPGQCAEKKKLMKLLASQTREVWEDNSPEANGVKKGKGPKRRSARVAGF